MKINIDYNEDTDSPEITFVFNTENQSLETKMLRRFFELSQDPTKKITSLKEDLNTGVSHINLKIEPI